MMKRTAVPFLLVAGMFLSIAVFAVPHGTEISSLPYEITRCGFYYVSQDLLSDGHGIIIKADNVKIDLMGHTLNGDQDGEDYGIHVAGGPDEVFKNISVRNGRIQQFGMGVLASHASFSVFEGLNVNDSTSCGIYLYGSNGRCNGNTIVDCNISGNGFYGLHLNGRAGECTGNTIKNCVINDNIKYGIYLYGGKGVCQGNSIEECSVTDSSSFGIYLDGRNGVCEGNRLLNCTLDGNANRGIFASHANSNRIEGNCITGTTGDFPVDILTTDSQDNLLVHNSVSEDQLSLFAP